MKSSLTALLSFGMFVAHLSAAGDLPFSWKFVADDWNFGRMTVGSHTDAAGRTMESVQFSFDAPAVRKQFADTRAQGGDIFTEAMAGRIYDGSHAVLIGGEIADGTIEADLCGVGRDDFQGILFRASDDALTSRIFDGDIIYFRPFYSNNEQPHYPAIQYIASQRDGAQRRVFARVEKDVKLPKDTWFHVRIEIRGPEARVFLDDRAEPQMIVPTLASGRTKGWVGLWAWHGRLANLKITPVLPQKL